MLKRQCKEFVLSCFFQSLSVQLQLNESHFVWETVPCSTASSPNFVFSAGFRYGSWLADRWPGRDSRWTCCSQLNHISHVIRPLVGLNKVHLGVQFVSIYDFIDSQCKRMRTGVMWSLDLLLVMRRAAATRCNGLIVDSGRPASAALQ